MALSAMENGKHAAVEVPLAYTLEPLETGRHFGEETPPLHHARRVLLRPDETLVLNMVRRGMLGTLLNGEAAYLHDLREEMFSNKGEGLWRRQFHTLSDGNLYPTHGLGPVANYMSINRGDRFDYMVSMSLRPAAWLPIVRRTRRRAIPSGKKSMSTGI